MHLTELIWILFLCRVVNELNIIYVNFFVWSILVKWLECQFLDTEVVVSNPGISILCPEQDTLSTLLQSTQL